MSKPDAEACAQLLIGKNRVLRSSGWGGILGGQVQRSVFAGQRVIQLRLETAHEPTEPLKVQVQSEAAKRQWLVHFHHSVDTVNPRRSRKYRAVSERSHRPLAWGLHERRSAITPSTEDFYTEHKGRPE